MPHFHFKTPRGKEFYIDASEPKVEDIQQKLVKLGYTPVKGKWDTVSYSIGHDVLKSKDGLLQYGGRHSETVTVWNVVKLSKECEGWKSIVICYPSDIAINFRRLNHMMTAAGMLEYSTYGNVRDGFRKLEHEDITPTSKPLPSYVKAVYKKPLVPSAGAGYGSWRHGKRKSKKQTTLRHKKRSRSLSSKSPKRRQRKKRTMSKRRQRR